jgi:hypothetical protein
MAIPSAFNIFEKILEVYPVFLNFFKLNLLDIGVGNPIGILYIRLLFIFFFHRNIVKNKLNTTSLDIRMMGTDIFSVSAGLAEAIGEMRLSMQPAISDILLGKLGSTNTFQLAGKNNMTRPSSFLLCFIFTLSTL